MTEALFQPFPMLPGRRAQAWRHQPAFSRPRHFHEEPEFNLVTRGLATLGVGERVVTLAAGDAVLFHPGQDHVLLSSTDDLGLFSVALRPELCARVGGPLSHASGLGCRLSEPETKRAQALLESLSTSNNVNDVETELGDLFSAVRGRSRGMHVLSRLALEHTSHEPSTTGSALAGLLRADPSALSRHFHDDVSVRFVEFRARRRLMAFVRSADGGASLSRAAVDAGFGSYAQCHRVFTRLTGCTPRDYFDGKRRDVDERYVSERRA